MHLLFLKIQIEQHNVVSKGKKTKYVSQISYYLCFNNDSFGYIDVLKIQLNNKIFQSRMEIAFTFLLERLIFREKKRHKEKSFIV